MITGNFNGNGKMKQHLVTVRASHQRGYTEKEVFPIWMPPARKIFVFKKNFWYNIIRELKRRLS